MTASLKIRQLESKISDLQNQHQHLLQERLQEIAALISAVDLAHIDDKTLLGGFFFLKDKITTQDPIMGDWHDAGEKFLRHRKPKLFSYHQFHERRKQRGDFPQTANQDETSYPQAATKKGIPPRQTPAPQATPQSSQKQPRPRDE